VKNRLLSVWEGAGLSSVPRFCPMYRRNEQRQ
jgi:hypothetical protein